MNTLAQDRICAPHPAPPYKRHSAAFHAASRDALICTSAIGRIPINIIAWVPIFRDAAHGMQHLSSTCKHHLPSSYFNVTLGPGFLVL
eukprot:4379933-Pyramimonas_sp.AAC.1